MRTFKFLFCATCLCGVGLFAKTALTQDVLDDKPAETQRSKGSDLDSLDRPVSGNTGRPKPRMPSNNSDPNFLDRPGLDNEFSPPGGAGGMRMSGAPRMGSMEPGGMSGAPMRARRVTRTVVEMRYEAIPKEELEASKKLQAAFQSLKTGKDDAARNAAADIIQQQLTTQFEADLKQREKELVEVEQRVKSLREQLDKRKAAQADIINLRLQTLVNDADGLGFPDSSFGTAEQFDALTHPVGRLEENSFERQPFRPSDERPFSRSEK